MKGQCLCGAVKIETADQTEITACHCGMCRKWSGAPFFAFDAKEIQLENADKVRCYRSSEWAERAFCAQCGTHLYYHLLSGGYYVSAGLFPQIKFNLNAQIFTDHQADYCRLANETPMLTEAQVLADIVQENK
ncbi:GFA family protein [Pasteurellaceae bacterium LIM206]|nr:GFA family protein [Pasteurellaceae bacterium LIM206]